MAPQQQMPEEPWALMAAAQMHSEGRLIQVSDHSDFRQAPIEDRRGPPSKEADRAMVEDQQLKPEPDKGLFSESKSKLSKDAGSDTLDDMQVDMIVKAVKRGMAARDAAHGK